MKKVFETLFVISFTAVAILVIILFTRQSHAPTNTTVDATDSDQLKPVIHLNEKYNFSFELPRDFYENDPIEGLYADNYFFTSRNINGDYNTMGPDDVQLSVHVFFNEEVFENVVIPNFSEPVEVAGYQTVLQEIEYATGCKLSTRFTHQNIPYEIILATIENQYCEKLDPYREQYKNIIKTFSFN